jgi:hypothetical protein
VLWKEDFYQSAQFVPLGNWLSGKNLNSLKLSVNNKDGGIIDWPAGFEAG